MINYYITKSKAGYYTLTVKSNDDVFKFQLLESKDQARELLPLAISNLGKRGNDIVSNGHQFSLI